MEELVTAEIVTVVPAGFVRAGLLHHHQLKDLQCGDFESC